MEYFDESEVREIKIADKNYPQLLKGLKRPPKTLRIRGNLPPNRKIIAIAGSRETTQSALDAAYRIGRILAQHGYTIATGLADGCDAAAVDGALSASGKVIGVAACGLKFFRDPTGRKLAQKIFATGGAVISEYPDHLSMVFRRHFLRQNQIIAGLSEQTIIVAADERFKSPAIPNSALRRGREIIITPYVKAEIKDATVVKNTGELKDALGIARQ